MKHLNIVLLSYSVALAGIVVVLAVMASQLASVEQFKDDWQQRVAPVSDTEPYGGCKEAARYPNTPGWKWCRDRGYLD